MDTLLLRISGSLGNFCEKWNCLSAVSCVKWRISLKTLCLVTSAYFVQDGFVTFVDALIKAMNASKGNGDFSDDQKSASLGMLDGLILFILGYLCLLGVEKNNISLIRWPTLTLFIYKVVEYFIQQLAAKRLNIESFHARGNSCKLATAEMRYLSSNSKSEWIGHFLIPSIHLVSLTFLLYKTVKERVWGRNLSRTYPTLKKRLLTLKNRRKQKLVLMRKGKSGSSSYTQISSNSPFREIPEISDNGSNSHESFSFKGGNFGHENVQVSVTSDVEAEDHDHDRLTINDGFNQSHEYEHENGDSDKLCLLPISEIWEEHDD